MTTIREKEVTKLHESKGNVGLGGRKRRGEHVIFSFQTILFSKDMAGHIGNPGTGQVEAGRSEVERLWETYCPNRRVK